MITDMFLSVLGISASVSVLIVLLLLLSPLLNKRYAAKWKYLIWIVLALRLVLPFGGAGGRSAADALRQLKDRVVPTEENAGEETEADGTVPGQLIVEVPGQMMTPLGVQAKENITILDIAALIWLSACLVYIFINIIIYFNYKNRIFRKGTIVKDTAVLQQLILCKHELGIRHTVLIMEYAGAACPMILGFLKPVLVLPEGCYGKEEMFFILKHELVHVKRKDLMVKLLLMAACALHWFNPLIRVMRKEAEVDMELACDERVVQGADPGMRRAYTETLLSTLHKGCEKNTMLSTGFYGGKKIMKKRFRHILEKTGKKNGFCMLMCALLLAVSAGTLAGCSVVKDKEEDSSERAAEAGEGEDAVLMSMAGNWIIDFDRTDPTLWGSGISLGNSMELSGTGGFRYFIGVGVGGEGQCEVEGGVATVSVEPYEEHGAEEEILTLQYGSDNGTEYIRMEWQGEEVFWKRDEQPAAENAGEDGFDENTRGAAGTAEEMITLTIMKEGMPEEKQARLVQESGYILYLPDGEWEKESADTWHAAANEDVRLWVAGFESGYPIEQVLTDEGYVPDETGMSKQEEGSSYHVRLFEAQTGIWCVFFRYPSEAEEGWGRELPVIAETFGVLLPEEHVTQTGTVSAQVLGYIAAFDGSTITIDRQERVTPESGDWKPEYNADAGFEIVDVPGENISYPVRSDCTYHVLEDHTGPVVDVAEDEFSVYFREEDLPLLWSLTVEEGEVVRIAEWYVP